MPAGGQNKITCQLVARAVSVMYIQDSLSNTHQCGAKSQKG